MFGGHLFASLLLFGFLVVVAVVGAAPPPGRETPLEILARRFASGEITAEEYQRARDLLEGGGKT
jgi:uncharacterized membrane protein